MAVYKNRNFFHLFKGTIKILHAQQGINLFVRDLKDILGNVKHSLLVHLASESQVLHHTLAGLQNLGKKMFQ